MLGRYGRRLASRRLAAAGENAAENEPRGRERQRIRIVGGEVSVRVRGAAPKKLGRMPFKDRARHDKWRAERLLERRRFLQGEKVRRGCSDCGYNKHHAALQFDHVPGRNYAKKRLVHMLGATLDRFVEYVKLLDVVCANCHSIRSFERGQFHGRKKLR